MLVVRGLLALLLLFSHCKADTGHPYVPMTPGTSITYLVFAITGTYDVPSGKISVSSNTYTNTMTITYSGNGYETYLPTNNLFVNFYHQAGTPDTPVTYFAGTLQDAKWTMPNNFKFIGEMINNLGNTVIPPEAKISKTPVAGEVLDTTSVVRTSPTNDTILYPNWHWRYTTIEYLPTWGPYVDCWRTGLREFHTQVGGANDWVYNYVFMKNKGMVNFWYGPLGANNTVTGYQFYAIDY